MDMSILGSLIAHSKQIQCTSLIRDHHEGISDIRRLFYKTMYKERYEKIIKESYLKLINIKE